MSSTRGTTEETLTGNGIAVLVADVAVLLVLDSVVLVGVTVAVGSVPVLLGKRLVSVSLQDPCHNPLAPQQIRREKK